MHDVVKAVADGVFCEEDDTADNQARNGHRGNGPTGFYIFPPLNNGVISQAAQRKTDHQF